MKPADLEPLEVIPDPVAQAALARRHHLMAAERRELFRVAATSALLNGGKHLTPQQRALAQKRAAVPALQEPLSDGAPDSSRQDLEAL